MGRARVRLTAAVIGAIACAAPGCVREHEVAAQQEQPPAPAPPVVPTPRAPTVDPPAQPASEPGDESPEIAAYPPPKIENVFVRRRGEGVELVVRVARVRGAQRYDLQVARTLLFEPLVAQGGARTRVVNLGPMPPGLFFVHARAVGDAGEGPFGDVRVVHANKLGVAKVMSVPATARAQVVSVAADTPQTPPATAPERPDAKPDPGRLGPLREHYERLARELAEVETQRRELQASAAALEARLVGSDAKSAGALREALATLEATRAQLDREIAAGLAELDRMAASASP